MPEATSSGGDSMIPTNVLPTPPSNLFAAAPTNLFSSKSSSEPWSRGKALAVIGGGSVTLVLILLLGLWAINSMKPVTVTPSPDPSAVTPPPVPVTTSGDEELLQTYSNDTYKNFTFSYDASLWSLMENGTSISLTSVTDPTKVLQIDLSKANNSMYTGNLSYFCGGVSKVLREGSVSGKSPSGSDMHVGLARARVDIANAADKDASYSWIVDGTYYYSQNYFSVNNYAYMYGDSKSQNINNGLCVDNYGVTAVTERDPSIADEFFGRILTRSLVRLLPTTSGWTNTELEAADNVVLTMTMSAQ